MPHAPVSVSVVIPVHNSAAHLKRCLAGLAASTLSPLDLIVVDDGSTDGSADVAREGGALVVRVPNGPRGPAAARNLGAARARGDVLLFLDADVVVHREALEQFARGLDEHRDVAAMFGSYDDTPDHGSVVSQYRNLLHHFVHQEGRREATTFWAGLGAVRRGVFEAVGGFDERYARPSIEDIELGGRLREAGHRIWLRPEIQATHLKRWTFTGMVRSDLRDRAIPWTRLILRQGKVPEDLNTSWASRASAAAVWTVVLSVCAAVAMSSPFRPVALLPFGARAAALGTALAALLTLVVLNRRLYAFLLRKRGAWFAVCGVALHGLYLAYSSAVFAAMAAASLAGSADRRERPA